MSSEQIIQTPYYSAHLYRGQVVGIILEEGTTDGDPHRKIKDTLPEHDDHGNYHQYVVADEETRNHWRKRLGVILARMVVREDLKRQGDHWRGNLQSTFLSELPINYELYVHKSQKSYDPRRDVYLFGSRYVTVFRSPAEFAYHLVWLVSGSPLKPDGKPDCDCVYCDPSRTQSEISYELKLRHKDPHAPVSKDAKSKVKVGKQATLASAEDHIAPHRAARDAALKLLFAFLQTNTPGALFAALPKYAGTDNGAVNGIQEDTDSFIARQSVRVRNAKDCWATLREGFVQPNAEVPPQLKRKGSSRARAVEEQPQMDNGEVEGQATRAPVGEHAWPVLEWVLCVLEKDEKLVEKSGQPLHSPLLVSQIPQPRSATSARWDIEAPLDVIFYCLKETDLRRRSLGIRLLALLVNLSATTVVDLPLFLNAIGSRLFSLNTDELVSVLAALPSSPATLQMRVLLCRNYLTDFGAGPGQSSTRPKPQARGQPRPAPTRRKQPESSPNDNLSSNVPAADTTSISRKFPTILPSEIVTLIESPCSTDINSSAQTLRIKLELALSYTLFRRQNGPDATIEAEWLGVLRDGRLNAAFETASRLVRKTRSKTSAAMDDRAIEGMKQLLAAVTVC
ncbi:uncharacterized protein B0H18DRAFT_1114066 [Fomitopsis serialis]|uniref:uncharacterized protein n=1 Tax=Fomitopsis serialis TaxID=139415 RepID=UPI002007EFCE|nr:uncharacterized protein B0H18DRAFT_1114066 [Neoantrodia serialis]KAH9935298.1 hypothetical protein B0H18DRAFT_1114066 [Neoantrodia serialis]